MRSEIVFIYHKDCFDGFTAAWVFETMRKRGLSIIDRPITWVPAQYGDAPPDCKGKEVWLVDFTFPREVMIDQVIKPSMRTVILDHHQTAEADLAGILEEVRSRGLQRQNDKVVFDMHRSGAGILYDELEREIAKRAGQHIPSPDGRRKLWLVDYVEDRDLWRWALPNSREVAAFVSSVPMTFAEWDAIDAIGYQLVAEGGRAILRYIDNYGDKACANATIEKLDEFDVPCINTQYMNISDHVGKLAELHPDAPFAMGYFRRADGKWQFSLRSRGNFDVSEVAKRFGGGGHKNAAGFQTDMLPWCQCIPGIIPLGENTE
jgi:oligoribonuclease NrnB/cAMP/cGMP phosphodiesterase (DHH superfamily)